jgi:hypothetical protein
MHLVGPYLTTTRYNSKTKKNQSKKLQAAQEEHEAWLRKMGVDKESLNKKLPKDKKGRRVGIYDIPDYNTGPRQTSDRIVGSTAKKTTNVYTGTLITGLATMHKSNCVPIISKEQAVEVSQMRRN